MKSTLILLFTLYFITPELGIRKKQIVGNWKMVGVLEYGKNTTSTHNPKDNRFIIINNDGTFLSGGDPFGENNGTWSLSENVISIDSEVDDDDSDWNVTFCNDTMVWTGIGHPRKENTSLLHIRVKN